MSMLIKTRNGLWLLPASLALAAGCASLGGGGGAVVSSEGSSSGGIQTRAIRAAPATRQVANESRPLSELNTPEAIAAREAATRSEPGQVAVAAPISVAVSASTAAEQGASKSDTHQQMPALRKGAKVRVRSAATLHARPSLSGESMPVVAAEFELGSQIYNAAGYWWYVTAGNESGWLLQTNIQR